MSDDMCGCCVGPNCFADKPVESFTSDMAIENVDAISTDFEVSFDSIHTKVIDVEIDDDGVLHVETTDDYDPLVVYLNGEPVELADD